MPVAGDPAPLLRGRDRPARGQHVGDRDRARRARLRAIYGVRGLALVPGGGTATRRATRCPRRCSHDGDREQQPAAAEHEPQRPHPARLSGRSGAHGGRGAPRLWPVTTQRLEDRYGRVATDLRVSLTDRCNLRCTYCMPAEGLDWLPNDEVLTDDEVVRLIRIGGRAARRHARSASPAASRCCAAAWSTSSRRTPALAPRPGDRRSPPTRSGWPAPRGRWPTPGLDRVNVSLDTVRPETFHQITRRDRLADVVAGLEAATRRGPRAGQGQRRAAARGRTTTRRPSCCAGASSAATSCGSSSRCRSTPSTAGAASGMVTADEIFDRARRRVRPRAGRRAAGQRARPSCSWSTAAPPPSASSRRSPGRSAATATGCG